MLSVVCECACRAHVHTFIYNIQQWNWERILVVRFIPITEHSIFITWAFTVLLQRKGNVFPFMYSFFTFDSGHGSYGKPPAHDKDLCFAICNDGAFNCDRLVHLDCRHSSQPRERASERTEMGPTSCYSNGMVVAHTTHTKMLKFELCFRWTQQCQWLDVSANQPRHSRDPAQ